MLSLEFEPEEVHHEAITKTHDLTITCAKESLNRTKTMSVLYRLITSRFIFIAFTIASFMMNSRRCFAELIINPGQNVSISCGEFEDCIIICNETSSCSNSRFQFRNNSISIELSATNACTNCEITTFNILSLNLSSTADSAFSDASFLSHNDSDGKIIVHCSATYSCSSSFHFKGNVKVEMKCTATESCRYATIRNANNEGLQLYAIGYRSCQNVRFLSDATSGQSVVICTNMYSCAQAMFYFNGKEPSKLTCGYRYACYVSVINAIIGVKIEAFRPIGTAGGHPAGYVVIIMPRDIINHDVSEFNFTSIGDNASPVFYSFFHRNINFTADHISRIFYRNGVEFSDYCDASDSVCITDMNMINDSVDNAMPFIIDMSLNESRSDIYPLDFSDYILNEDALFIVADPYKRMSPSNLSIWIPPVFSNNKSFLSIISFDCRDILFDFDSIQHVIIVPIITVAHPDLGFITNVKGPKTTFIYYGQDIVTGGTLNTATVPVSTYYLNETEFVFIKSATRSTFFLGYNINFNFVCNAPYISTGTSTRCSYIDIYTLWNPMNITLQLSGWNIDCTSCGLLNGDKGHFDIHFMTINMTCSYLRDGAMTSECDLISAAPTASPSATPTALSVAPTASPSTAPTTPSAMPTIAPSAPPTVAPSAAPTAPSAIPSAAPTAIPSASPSNAPTSPTVIPSFAPSAAPTSPPTIAPTAIPSISPSNAPTTCYGDKTADDEETIQEMLLKLSFDSLSSNKTLNITETAKYAQLLISASNIEYILCTGLVSCLQSSVIMINNSLCNILCNGFMSCLAATINIEQCNDVHIICNGEQACQNAQLIINSSQIMDATINIECGQSSSCNLIMISIIGEHVFSNISCYEINACDDMSITVENYELSTLFMYSFSSNIVFDNLYGFRDPNSDAQYVVCNTKKKYIEWNKNMNLTQISQVITDKYKENKFPCTDVTIECKKDINDTDSTTLCEMDYDISQTINIPSIAPSDSCFWLSIDELIEEKCYGECVSSPTRDPTTAPTIAPTKPSLNPTNAPSLSPTQYPSVSPTFVPTDAPSVSPTLTPSSTPTNAPTISPSSIPTFSPSFAPIINPTMSPSASPTSTPSVPPTAAPSRFPTEDADEIYKAYIEIEYRIQDLTKNNIYWITNNTISVINGFERIIESNYFDETLLYTDFWVQIQTVNDKEIQNDENKLTIYDLDIVYLSEPMRLNGRVKSNSQKAEFIKSQSNTKSFKENSEKQLQIYFGNNALQFSVFEPEKLQIQHQYISKPDLTYVIISIVIVSIGGLFSFFAFIFNKVPFTKVDNAAFYVPLLLSLSIYDFLSDIVFNISVFNNAKLELTDIIFWLGVCSALFTILPFASNLYYATTINAQSTIQASPSARNWFSNYLAPFIFFCIITAGTYPALLLCSSRLFGLEFLNSGLLSTELHTLSIIKMRSTIYLENGPQLFLQILYSIFTNSVESETILAFIASSLSVIASVMIFKAQKNLNEQYIIRKYFVGIEKSGGFDNDEHKKILFGKGLKDKLSKLLCQAFKTPSKAIQIGYVTLGNNAFYIHVQHAIFRTDMDALKEKLWDLRYQSAAGFHVQITPDLYIMTLFKENSNDVNRAIASHFDLNESEITSSYYKTWENANTADSNDDKNADVNIIDEMAKKINRQQTRGYIENVPSDGLVTEMTSFNPRKIGKQNDQSEQPIFDMLKTLDFKMASMDSKMDSKFTSMDSKFTSMDSKFTSMDSKIQQLMKADSVQH